MRFEPWALALNFREEVLDDVGPDIAAPPARTLQRLRSAAGATSKVVDRHSVTKAVVFEHGDLGITSIFKQLDRRRSDRICEREITVFSDAAGACSADDAGTRQFNRDRYDWRS